ncbi:RHS repeat-associated core domain-containing protein, partial [Paracidobacterium acidisoli]
VAAPSISGGTSWTGYLYDADGNRVAKGTITQWSCNMATNGFTLTASYVLDQSGNQMTEQDGQGNWVHTNVYANGSLMATYNNQGLHFRLTDWLGTLRAQTSADGILEETCASLPFGDTSTPCVSATEHFFTGKERDTESGNDFFNARYYSSSMGRFLSPDPILQNDLRLLNPQRWNKYVYVINNPLILTDPTGKDAAYVDFSKSAGGAGHAGLLSIRSNGTATYSAFMPEGSAAAYAPGKVQTQDLDVTVQFGANGLPTDASYNALIQAVAKINGSDAYNVGIDYFKTTDSETANLDQYIVQKTAAYREGKAPTYKLCFYDCRDYALGGLVAAGVLGKGQAHGFSLDPNSAFWELGLNANQQVPPKPKATVTTSECDTLPDGTQRCY